MVFATNGNVDRMAIDSTGNLQFNSGYGSVATAFGCRAWVNFNGTGTVAINASGNVSSITDNGTGLYTVNFTTAMPDANYSINCLASGSNVIIAHLNGSTAGGAPSVKTTSAAQIRIATAGNTAIDCADINVSVFR
jgi:hypothetical protein